jgi:protein pelota
MQVLLDNTRNEELVVLIDCLDDLWVLYNILKAGDRLKGRTFRRVVLREGDKGERKPMTLAITIEKVEFHEFTNRLRALGVIFEGPEDWVSTGQHHTFNLEPGSKIRIYKDQWFRNDIERIRKNLNKKESDTVLCIAIESGNANISLLSNYSLNLISEVRENIPGKRFKKQFHNEAMDRFFKQISTILKENMKRHNSNLVIVCGPGFTKGEFYEYYKEHLMRGEKMIDMRTMNASSGEISAVYEILRNGSIASIKKNFRLAQDEVLMSSFIENLGKDDSMVAYGIDQVRLVAEMGAVETLLICDILLRNSDIETRKMIEDTLNQTENSRGVVHILSTANPAGEQLERYGKIAAILRYKVQN